MRKLLAIFFIFVFSVSCAKKQEVKVRPFSIEEAFKEANELLKEKRYEDARQKLQQIKMKDETMKYTPLAQLRIADSYLQEKEPELAVEEYRRFLETFPEHKYSPYAIYQIGMVYYGLIEDSERGYGAASKALEAFEQLNSRYPRNPYREEVGFKIERCKEIIADHEYRVGEFYYKKEAYRGALGRFLGLLQRFPDYGKEPDVLLRIAISYKKLGENEKAKEYFSLLMKKYPESKAVEEAKKEFAELPQDSD
jgi:outer membrane protein assembly factor BamD